MIDLSIPPQRNFRIAHTAPKGLTTAEVVGSVNADAVRAASAALPDETGKSSTAGHYKILQKAFATATRLDVAVRNASPGDRKDGIYP
jgi:hypothetical protein